MKFTLVVWLVVFLLCTTCLPLWAAIGDEEVVSVPRSALTTEQKASYDTEAALRKAGKYVGLGKEIGEAVNSSLTALTDSTAKFAHTSVGKFVLVIVAWKVIGQDATQLFIGVIFAIVWISIWYRSFKRVLPGRATASEEYDSNTGNLISRKYEQLNNIKDYNTQAALMFHAFCFVVLTAGNITLIFA